MGPEAQRVTCPKSHILGRMKELKYTIFEAWYFNLLSSWTVAGQSICGWEGATKQKTCIAALKGFGRFVAGPAVIVLGSSL